MKRASIWLFVFCVLITTFASAQRRRDPLNEKESDQLRETAVEPLKRMRLLIGFARTRMDTIQQMRANTKLLGPEGSEQIRKLLEDIAAIVDETDENFTTYNGKSSDLRKPLHQMVETDTDFQLRLRTLKETSSPEELRTYGFALETAIDSVNASADSARAMLDEQNASRGKEKPLTAKEEEKQRKQEEKELKERERLDEKENKRKLPCPAPC